MAVKSQRLLCLFFELLSWCTGAMDPAMSGPCFHCCVILIVHVFVNEGLHTLLLTIVFWGYHLRSPLLSTAGLTLVSSGVMCLDVT
jgi:hypothetical protein